jgi:hypothetical protein
VKGRFIILVVFTCLLAFYLQAVILPGLSEVGLHDGGGGF